MPSWLPWVLAGLLLYTLVAVFLDRRGSLPESFKVSGPLLTIHTKRGRQFLDDLSARKRFWRAWGNLGVGIALVVMVLSAILVVVSVISVFSQPEASAIESPQNVLVIPGVNEFLPLSAAGEIIIGLAIGLVVHEGGHGLLCRVEDIDIDSMGLILFSLIPLGAFVQPDGDELMEADRGTQIRMYAAGITNNFAITVIVLLLLVPVAGSIAVVGGAPIGDTFPDSGAQAAGIEGGDVITGVDGIPVENASHLESVVADREGATLELELRDGETATVERQLQIIGAVEPLVPGIDFDQSGLPRVESVNGTAVATEREFAGAVGDRPVASIETDRGSATVPVGALVSQVNPGGAFDEAGAPTDGTPVIITHIDETRIANQSAVGATLADHEPGETVAVTAYVDGHREAYEVTLDAAADDRPILNVGLERGYSGLLFNDFGVDPYPAEGFLGMLTGEAVPDDVPFPASAMVYMGFLLILPFATLFDPGINYNFAGFTGDVSAFFVVEGPLAVFGGVTLVLANILFWTWWLNFNLALFNCIPAFPLDGGHILRASTESVAARLPIESGREVVSFVTITVSLGMILGLLVMIFGPAFLI